MPVDTSARRSHPLRVTTVPTASRYVDGERESLRNLRPWGRPAPDDGLARHAGRSMVAEQVEPSPEEDVAWLTRTVRRGLGRGAEPRPPPRRSPSTRWS